MRQHRHRTKSRNSRFGGEARARLGGIAVAAGWTITDTRGTHKRWKSPDGRTIIHDAATTGDRRSVLNLRAQLRRAGLKV